MHPGRPILTKPPRGTRIDRSNPLVSDLLISYLFNEMGGVEVYSGGSARIVGHLRNGPTWETGKRGPYLRFDGIDDWLEMGSNDPKILEPANITCEIIAFVTGDNNFTPLIARSSGSQADYNLEVKFGGSPPYRVMFQVATDGALPFANPTADVVKDREWFHAFGTYDGAVCRVYFNGIEQASDASGSGPIKYDAFGVPAKVIFGDNANLIFTNGGCLLARIWSRALTPGEIMALTKNPWQIYEQSKRSRYFAGTAPTVFTEILDLLQSQLWDETDAQNYVDDLDILQPQPWEETDLQSYIDDLPIVSTEIWEVDDLQNYLDTPDIVQGQPWEETDLQSYLETLDIAQVQIWEVIDSTLGIFTEILDLLQSQLWNETDAQNYVDDLDILQPQPWEETDLQSYAENLDIIQALQWSMTDLQGYLEDLQVLLAQVWEVTDLQSYIETLDVNQMQFWEVIDSTLGTFTEILDLLQSQLWNETDAQNYVDGLDINQPQQWEETDLQSYLETLDAGQGQQWSATDLQSYKESLQIIAAQVWQLVDTFLGLIPPKARYVFRRQVNKVFKMKK